MANWAIVVGIDAYWKPEVCLRGAVRDALRMRTWLIDPDGGNVPPQNLVLLLGPDARPVPAGIAHEPATKDTLVRAVDRLLKKSGGEGERLFFYFAGHGLQLDVALNRYEHALVATDFDYVVADRSVALSSLVDYFAATAFREQFFFVDACRNVPGRRFVVGQMPSPPERDFTQPAPQQFVLSATSPGLTAAESQLYGKEGGVFTGALMDGLRGEGLAKRYDAGADQYVVRWSSLCEFVTARVEALRIASATARHLIQVPREGGERRPSNPELARLAPAHFAPQQLEVLVAPNGVVPTGEITVYELGDPTPVERITPLPGVRVPFQLPPKPYSVLARALGYVPERRNWQVELYEPQQVNVTLRPAPPPAPPPPPPSAPSPAPPYPAPPSAPPMASPAAGAPKLMIDRPITVGRGIDDWDAVSPSLPTAPGPLGQSISVRIDDPLAPLELLDMTGQVLRTGQGNVVWTELAPGGYRVRLRTPEGNAPAETIALERGEHELVHLSAPERDVTPMQLVLLERASIDEDGQRMTHVSEQLGPLALAEPSTVVAMAAVRGTYPDPRMLGWGYRLANVGLRPARDWLEPPPTSALSVVLADDRPGPEGVAASVTLRVAPLGDDDAARDERAVVVPETSGRLADYGRPMTAGTYTLALLVPGRAPTRFVVPLLPAHVTLLVVHGRPSGDVAVFMYTPPTRPAANEMAAALHRVRRLELVQRAILHGRYDVDDADMLLGREWRDDPLARVLGCYIALRAGQVGRVRAEAQRLAERFPAWSDVRLLLAECHAAERDRDAAAAEYRRALDAGVPVFAGGLARLASAVRRLELATAPGALLDRVLAGRVPGVLWTAYAAPVTDDGDDVAVAAEMPVLVT